MANLKRIGIILLVSGVVAVVANSVHPRKIPWIQDWSRQVETQAVKQGIKVVPLAVAQGRLAAGQSVFIDARSAEKYMEGHIPGAVSIPFEELDDCFPVIMDLIDTERELVVYCKDRECDDALLLAVELQAMGVSNLVLYIDGFELWEAHGGEVER